MTPAERPAWARACDEIGLDPRDLADWRSSRWEPRPSALSAWDRGALLLDLERGSALRAELDAWLRDPAAQAARKEINKAERAAKRQKEKTCKPLNP